MGALDHLAAMSTPRVCSECGSAISESSRDGHCPRCLIGLALGSAEETRSEGQSHESALSQPAGRVFGNYELLEEIGRGGMGVVFKARQRTLDRVVALKLTLAGSQSTAAEIKRFHTEAKAAATLQHPNVVAIHEVGEHEGVHYFSMDYIDGSSLAQVISRTPLPAGRAARYVKIIAEAIHYAHQRGILHRDLKPHNVIIDATDEPRVTDFGLARQFEVDSDLTISGAVLGTPSYMPPEQAEGRGREIGPASDVYSLGAILYDGLTGRPPFRADTPLDTLRQVIESEPAPPRLLNRKVPRDLETICLKCLAKAPSQRYASAQELADDLGRFIKREPILARPVGWLGRGWRWGRRNPVVAGLTATSVLLLLMMATAAALFHFDGIDTNKYVAQIASKGLSSELLRLQEQVEQVADGPELREVVRANNHDGMTILLKQTHGQYGTNGANRIGVEGWMFLGTNGRRLARWPDEGNTNNFGERDYFQGALDAAGRGAARAHVSLVFKSEIDQHYKFGVSKVVRDGNGANVGVIVAMAGTQSIEEILTLTAPGRKLAVVGKFDRSKPNSGTNESRDFVIILHPSFHAGVPAVSIDHPLLKSLIMAPADATAVDYASSYSDPVGKQDPRYLGRWLAGFARVPDTPLIIVYQTRNRVADALATAALVTALAILLAFGWRFSRNRRTGIIE